MGQKVNPNGIRLGITKTWNSKWYAGPREYADILHEDFRIKKVINQSPEVKGADISNIEIIRYPQRVTVVIHTSKPGIIIGSKGSTIDAISTRVQKVASKKVAMKVKEIKKPEIDAQIVALNVARQLSGRASFKRVLKMSVNNAMKGGAQGIKIKISGRLGGADMARAQEHKAGRVPLHTLRADIDYGFAEANTTYGLIGVKVWIFKGEVFSKDSRQDAGSVVKKKPQRGAKKDA